jgi:hypothetical protein
MPGSVSTASRSVQTMRHESQRQKSLPDDLQMRCRTRPCSQLGQSMSTACQSGVTPMAVRGQAIFRCNSPKNGARRGGSRGRCPLGRPCSVVPPQRCPSRSGWFSCVRPRRLSNAVAYIHRSESTTLSSSRLGSREEVLPSALACRNAEGSLRETQAPFWDGQSRPPIHRRHLDQLPKVNAAMAADHGPEVGTPPAAWV